MNEETNFGNIIVNARKNMKISQNELAEKIHVTRQAISRWENNISFPDKETLPILSNVLNIDIYLLKKYYKRTNDNIEELNKILTIETDEIRKKYVKTPILVLIIVVLFSLITLFSIASINKFFVYKLSLDSEYYDINGSFLIISNVKNYLQLGTLKEKKKNNELIYRIRIFSKKDNKETTIVDLNYEDNMNFYENNGYNEFFTERTNLSDIYMDIFIVEKDKIIQHTYPIKLKLIMKNNPFFNFKRKQIGNFNDDSIKSTNDNIVDNLIENNYTYSETENNYKKTINNISFVYSIIGNQLLCNFEESKKIINISYYIDKAYISVEIYDTLKAEYISNFEYDLTKNKIECSSIKCFHDEKYIDIVKEEYELIKKKF